MATTITPTIVTVNTTVTRAPTVSQLQQSGAIVSAGGTTLTAGTYQYCGTLSAVQALLATPLALTGMVWSSGTVTATTAATIGLATGQTFTTIIAGATPAAYNGTYSATVTGANTFTFALATNPGTETVPGTYLPSNAGFISNSATTFFAQGNAVGVYVLELGAQTTAASAITALQTWITANSNPQVFYAYLLPAAWDAASSAALNTMTANYDSPSGQTYFFVTTTVSNLPNYANNKAVYAQVPSPTKASTEHQLSVDFYNWLANKPGSSNPLAPMSYRYAYGVTPWAQVGNQTNINTVLTNYGNLILTGAEGGISTACIFKGTTMDGEQAAWWYGIDWFRIQVKQALAAAIINGSNSNPPLLYDQNGINTLLAVAQNVANSAVKFGCALSAVVTAVPFSTYTTENPNDYNAGIYNGFSATVVGQNAFLTLTLNLDATQFVA
ncbi:hypothetical protein LMG22037_06450 [Paraburkholderia phenoliruptrix]|uniref:Uncharacterized protein n=1 Tax=Paraburkholderia phenoliruptrix TaxID=252970 RepID=A0A6J5CQB6_9BURK|nr:hypothetical protein [Paraburkholderia phenoliruptrix]CAB3741080.1 hypothetical protein LMG22037_06450 [Paraburkholderia phenoliruptrix]